MAQVALVHGQRQPVLGGVPPRELGVVGLQLEAVQVEPGHARGEAERRGAGAAAELEHALARPRRNEGGEQHRDRSPRDSPRRGCQSRRRPSRKASQVSSAGAKLIPRTSDTPLSRRTARARNASRSATISRRGRRPIEPSITLMWTSRTKQSISSPRSSAVLKAMTVGSLVRRISRMARSLKTASAEVESQKTMDTTARVETPFEDCKRRWPRTWRRSTR